MSRDGGSRESNKAVSRQIPRLPQELSETLKQCHDYVAATVLGVLFAGMIICLIWYLNDGLPANGAADFVGMLAFCVAAGVVAAGRALVEFFRLDATLRGSAASSEAGLEQVPEDREVLLKSLHDTRSWWPLVGLGYIAAIGLVAIVYRLDEGFRRNRYNNLLWCSVSLLILVTGLVCKIRVRLGQFGSALEQSLSKWQPVRDEPVFEAIVMPPADAEPSVPVPDIQLPARRRAIAVGILTPLIAGLMFLGLEWWVIHDPQQPQWRSQLFRNSYTLQFAASLFSLLMMVWVSQKKTTTPADRKRPSASKVFQYYLTSSLLALPPALGFIPRGRRMRARNALDPDTLIDDCLVFMAIGLVFATVQLWFWTKTPKKSAD